MTVRARLIPAYHTSPTRAIAKAAWLGRYTGSAAVLSLPRVSSVTPTSIVPQVTIRFP